MKLRQLLGIKPPRREQKLLQVFKQYATTLQLQQAMLHSNAAGVGNNLPQELVVSLTTFSKRIHDVYLTIESLFQQTLKADRVVLWLSGQDFKADDIPQSLRRLEARGLTIAFCEEDLGPYTKFYYAVQQYPDALLVTVDDDILYPTDMLDQLYHAWAKAPDVVHCHRAHKIGLDRAGRLLPYKQWDKATRDSKASKLILPTGVGGVLYFPGCFHGDLLNKALFQKLAPRADDVWLKAMTLKQGVLCKKVDDDRPWDLRNLTVEYSQRTALKYENKKSATGNDPKIEQTFSHYGLLPELVKS